MPNSSGGQPAVAKATNRACAFRPSSAALASDMTTTAAAPSLIGELLPAVTVPFTWNAGFNPASTSSEVSARGSSSLSKTNDCVAGLTGPLGFVPLLLGREVIFTSTGTVSSLNFSAASAATAFLWESKKPLRRNGFFVGVNGELVRLFAGDTE